MVSFWFFVALWFTPIIGEPTYTPKPYQTLEGNNIKNSEPVHIRRAALSGLKAFACQENLNFSVTVYCQTCKDCQLFFAFFGLLKVHQNLFDCCICVVSAESADCWHVIVCAQPAFLCIARGRR